MRWLLLGRPEDLGDCVNLREETVGNGDVVGLLGFTGRLRGLPEEVVKFTVRSEVLGLEVVGPQNPEVVLDQLATLFLNRGGTNLEVVVRACVVLLHAGLHGLGFDLGLRRVVHTARKVAVRVHRARGGIELCADSLDQCHWATFHRWFPPGFDVELGHGQISDTNHSGHRPMHRPVATTRTGRGREHGAHLRAW